MIPSAKKFLDIAPNTIIPTTGGITMTLNIGCRKQPSIIQQPFIFAKLKNGHLCPYLTPLINYVQIYPKYPQKTTMRIARTVNPEFSTGKNAIDIFRKKLVLDFFIKIY
jgi:hypothetical protein